MTTTTSYLQQLREKLITHEDFLHVHKILGILCLGSFVVRLAQREHAADLGFADLDWTVPTVLLHLSLSVTSLGFKIPQRRIKEGSRIWPEFRLHSLFFTCRSLAVILLYWYERTYRVTPNYRINLAIVLVTMILVDWSSASQKHRSNSIRQLATNVTTQYCFSLAQFYATACHVFGMRRASMPFLMVLVVQLTPFTMTLRRKNLLSHNLYVVLYGLMLVGGLVGTMRDFVVQGDGTRRILALVSFVGNVAFLWRTNPVFPRWLANKYLIWTSMGIMLEWKLRAWAEEPITSERQMLYGAAQALMVLNGVWKAHQRRKDNKTA